MLKRLRGLVTGEGEPSHFVLCRFMLIKGPLGLILCVHYCSSGVLKAALLSPFDTLGSSNLQDMLSRLCTVLEIGGP